MCTVKILKMMPGHGTQGLAINEEVGRQKKQERTNKYTPQKHKSRLQPLQTWQTYLRLYRIRIFLTFYFEALSNIWKNDKNSTIVNILSRMTLKFLKSTSQLFKISLNLDLVYFLVIRFRLYILAGISDRSFLSALHQEAYNVNLSHYW